jgi:hypothetical protein
MHQCLHIEGSGAGGGEALGWWASHETDNLVEAMTFLQHRLERETMSYSGYGIIGLISLIADMTTWINDFIFSPGLHKLYCERETRPPAVGSGDEHLISYGHDSRQCAKITSFLHGCCYYFVTFIFVSGTL